MPDGIKYCLTLIMSLALNFSFTEGSSDPHIHILVALKPVVVCVSKDCSTIHVA